MRAKDEILTNTGEAAEYIYNCKVTPVIAAHTAMDEHAKEVAIDFADWLSVNGYLFGATLERGKLFDKYLNSKK